MISDEKQYEFITRQIGDLARATHDGLKLFLPMFSAIVGGSIWLRLQSKEKAPYEYLTDALVIMLTVVCIAITLTNLKAWWGYRRKLSEITAKTKYPAPKPVLFPSALIEMIMCLAMLATCAIFVFFNPFKLSN
jgi:fumarate reductase subunit C